MQLPSGTFHSIKRNKALKGLIDEAHELRFSGGIVISLNGKTPAVVLKNGTIILAEYSQFSGNDALKEINKFQEQLVDAEYRSYTDPQLSLAQEFNKSCRIQEPSKSSILFVKREQIQSEKSVLSGRNLTTTILDGVDSTNSVSKFDEDTINSKNTFGSTLPDSLDALDTIDLDKMEGKIRINAKNIARKLDFDHLIVDEQEQRNS